MAKTWHCQKLGTCLNFFNWPRVAIFLMFIFIILEYKFKNVPFHAKMNIKKFVHFGVFRNPLKINFMLWNGMEIFVYVSPTCSWILDKRWVLFIEDFLLSKLICIILQKHFTFSDLNGKVPHQLNLIILIFFFSFNNYSCSMCQNEWIFFSYICDLIYHR